MQACKPGLGCPSCQCGSARSFARSCVRSSPAPQPLGVPLRRNADLITACGSMRRRYDHHHLTRPHAAVLWRWPRRVQHHHRHHHRTTVSRGCRCLPPAICQVPRVHKTVCARPTISARAANQGRHSAVAILSSRPASDCLPCPRRPNPVGACRGSYAVAGARSLQTIHAVLRINCCRVE
jgi:hypothetical protein